jgi:hypothetical protein
MISYTVLDTSYEFSVFDDEYEVQAYGSAPTLAQACDEGRHYLAVYSKEGPHTLEIRRVEHISFPS